MKTYTKSIELPRLKICYDTDTGSPRDNGGNIGHFFTKNTRYNSPDGTTHALYEIMVDTAEGATSTENHMQLIKDRARRAFKESSLKDEDLHIIEIHPVVMVEHGSVVYRRGAERGFDCSNNGFYIVTAQTISGETFTAGRIAKCIDAELETYTQWVNGEVYAFTLYDENGEVQESCGNMYSIEDIREYLPKEWKGERLEDYEKF